MTYTLNITPIMIPCVGGLLFALCLVLLYKKFATKWGPILTIMCIGLAIATSVGSLEYKDIYYNAKNQETIKTLPIEWQNLYAQMSQLTGYEGVARKIIWNDFLQSSPPKLKIDQYIVLTGRGMICPTPSQTWMGNLLNNQHAADEMRQVLDISFGEK
jgi:hypothetical protein